MQTNKLQVVYEDILRTSQCYGTEENSLDRRILGHFAIKLFSETPITLAQENKTLSFRWPVLLSSRLSVVYFILPLSVRTCIRVAPSCYCHRNFTLSSPGGAQSSFHVSPQSTPF